MEEALEARQLVRRQVRLLVVRLVRRVQVLKPGRREQSREMGKREEALLSIYGKGARKSAKEQFTLCAHVEIFLSTLRFVATSEQ